MKVLLFLLFIIAGCTNIEKSEIPETNSDSIQECVQFLQGPEDFESSVFTQHELVQHHKDNIEIVPHADGSIHEAHFDLHIAMDYTDQPGQRMRALFFRLSSDNDFELYNRYLKDLFNLREYYSDYEVTTEVVFRAHPTVVHEPDSTNYFFVLPAQKTVLEVYISGYKSDKEIVEAYLAELCSKENFIN